MDIDIQRVREFLREKQNRRRSRLEERLEQARNDADRIIEHLGRMYSPRRIYQWGSLVESKNFSEISDIDIGVEGLSGPETSISQRARWNPCRRRWIETWGCWAEHQTLH